MSRERRGYCWCGWTLLLASSTLLAATTDGRVRGLAWNSLWVGLGACALAVPVGTLLALALCRTDLPARRLFLWLTVALLFVPLYLCAAAWDAGFGQLGWYSVSRDSIQAPLLRGSGAVMWIHGLWSVPWVTLIVAAALQWSEPELEEAALLDATYSQVFLRITLRRAWPGVITAAVWVLLVMSGEIVVTDLYQVRTLAEELYTSYALGDESATVLGLRAACLVTGALTGASILVLDRWMVLTRHVPRRAPFVFSLGRWRWLVLLLVLVALLPLVVVPLGNLVYQVGLVTRQVDGPSVTSWSWRRCLELLVPWPSTYRFAAAWEYRRPLAWTLLISVSAATLTLVLAAPLAWLGRRGGWRALPAVLLAAAGLGVLGPLAGAVLLRLLSMSEPSWVTWLRDQSILAPVLAATWRSLPMAILICWTAFNRLSSTLLDAAMVDGAGSLARFVLLGVRLRVAGLMVAWFVSLAIACGELPASILVVPAGVTTVPIRVFGLLHAGVANQAAALCLTNMFGLLLVAAVVQWLGVRVWRRSRYG